jgi:glutamate formiminotransferase
MISTTTTIHNVRFLLATSTRSFGAPLTLHVEDKDENRSSVVLFCSNQKLVDALVEAINAACQGHDALVDYNVSLPDDVA